MSNGGILAFCGESLGFELVVGSDENVSGAISRMKQRRSRNLKQVFLFYEVRVDRAERLVAHILRQSRAAKLERLAWSRFALLTASRIDLVEVYSRRHEMTEMAMLTRCAERPASAPTHFCVAVYCQRKWVTRALPSLCICSASASSTITFAFTRVWPWFPSLPVPFPSSCSSLTA